MNTYALYCIQYINAVNVKRIAVVKMNDDERLEHFQWQVKIQSKKKYDPRLDMVDVHSKPWTFENQEPVRANS